MPLQLALLLAMGCFRSPSLSGSCTCQPKSPIECHMQGTAGLSMVLRSGLMYEAAGAAHCRVTVNCASCHGCVSWALRTLNLKVSSRRPRCLSFFGPVLPLSSNRGEHATASGFVCGALASVRSEIGHRALLHFCDWGALSRFSLACSLACSYTRQWLLPLEATVTLKLCSLGWTGASQASLAAPPSVWATQTAGTQFLPPSSDAWHRWLPMTP